MSFEKESIVFHKVQLVNILEIVSVSLRLVSRFDYHVSIARHHAAGVVADEKSCWCADQSANQGILKASRPSMFTQICPYSLVATTAGASWRGRR